MHISYIPLLEIQRDLYRMSRDMKRFQQYLRTIVNKEGSDVALPPLVVVNPMAREHVADLMGDYFELNVDEVATEAASKAEAALLHLDGEYNVGLVVCDDWKGGWTNRYATEFMLRCGNSSRTGKRARRRENWLTAALWSSEAASITKVREAVLTAAFRAAYRSEHGPARTIRQMLAQEGHCMSQAGCTSPALDVDELEYTRDVIEPYLEAGDMPTSIACLFGDTAARSLGFPCIGLSERAGLALALHERSAV
jgi:hypothetical protein